MGVFNILTIEGKKEMRRPFTAQLYDLNGTLRQSFSSFKNKFTMDISSLPPGIYTFKLYNTYGSEMQIEKDHKAISS